MVDLSKAIGLGFCDAVLLRDLRLECRQHLRDYCKDCDNHSDNWVCPPASGTLSQCQDRVNEFDVGILLRSVTDLTPPTEMSVFRRLNYEHNARLLEFLRQLPRQKLALTTGGCILCPKCTYPEPCVKPDLKMHSLSAYGIDVGNLCERAGLAYGFSPDRVYFVALVLVK